MNYAQFEFKGLNWSQFVSEPVSRRDHWSSGFKLVWSCQLKPSGSIIIYGQSVAGCSGNTWVLHRAANPGNKHTHEPSSRPVVQGWIPGQISPPLTYFWFACLVKIIDETKQHGKMTLYHEDALIAMSGEKHDFVNNTALHTIFWRKISLETNWKFSSVSFYEGSGFLELAELFLNVNTMWMSGKSRAYTGTFLKILCSP